MLKKMKEDTKSMISLSLETLRKILIEEGVSIGMDGKNKQLLFFDTDTYLEAGKFDGFKVDIESLVK